jgi:hypothetical protein
LSLTCAGVSPLPLPVRGLWSPSAQSVSCLFRLARCVCEDGLCLDTCAVGGDMSNLSTGDLADSGVPRTQAWAPYSDPAAVTLLCSDPTTLFASDELSPLSPLISWKLCRPASSHFASSRRRRDGSALKLVAERGELSEELRLVNPLAAVSSSPCLPLAGSFDDCEEFGVPFTRTDFLYFFSRKARHTSRNTSTWDKQLSCFRSSGMVVTAYLLTK